MNRVATILYIVYVELSLDNNSGSGIRPTRLYHAFVESGYNVILLSGNQMAKTRPHQIEELIKKIKLQKPDICYIESPTYPIMRCRDRQLIRQIHHLGIPIGYFYRDFYWKFPEQFPRRTTLLGRIKDFGLDILQYLTDKTLSYCDIVYFPSKKASELYNYKNKGVLPPAGQNCLVKQRKPNKVGIYVGGVIGPYDASLLLNTYQSLYEVDHTYRLILVCRANEWNAFKHPCKNAPWLEVYHASGEFLVSLYHRASLAFVIPRKDMSYNNLAVSVKTFEYLSYGLPIIAVNCDAIKEIVEGEKIGLAINPDVHSFAHAIETMLDGVTYDMFQANLHNSLMDRNLWKHRVERIVSDLSLIRYAK